MRRTMQAKSFNGGRNFSPSGIPQISTKIVRKEPLSQRPKNFSSARAFPQNRISCAIPAPCPGVRNGQAGVMHLHMAECLQEQMVRFPDVREFSGYQAANLPLRDKTC